SSFDRMGNGPSFETLKAGRGYSLAVDQCRNGDENLDIPAFEKSPLDGRDVLLRWVDWSAHHPEHILVSNANATVKIQVVDRLTLCSQLPVVRKFRIELRPRPAAISMGSLKFCDNLQKVSDPAQRSKPCSLRRLQFQANLVRLQHCDFGPSSFESVDFLACDLDVDVSRRDGHNSIVQLKHGLRPL